MRAWICLFIMISCLSIAKANTFAYEIGFARLDSVLDHKEDYEKALLGRIRKLQIKAAETSTPEEAYLINNFLFNEYRTYISDSAMVYIRKNEKLAREHQNCEWMAETLINKSFIYAVTGFFSKSEEALKKAAKYITTKRERINYYIQYIYLHNHIANFYNISQRVEVEQYCDSILAIDQSPDSNAYLWARFWKEYDRADTVELQQLIKMRIEQFAEPYDVWYSNMCFALAFLYKNDGKEASYVNYLLQLVINDIINVNHDNPLIQFMVDLACEQGDFLRAYRYMQYTLAHQAYYPERAMSGIIVERMQLIYDTAAKSHQQERAQKHLIIYCLIVLSVVLLIAFALLLFSKRNQQRTRTELMKSNRELDKYVEETARMNAELKAKNEQIAQINHYMLEANYIKEEYIVGLFAEYSAHITRMDEMRKLVNRKLRAKQYDELLKQTSSSSNVTSEEVLLLYKTFDEIFLNIYPDFVADFNTLLQPEEQIILKDNKILTNELRIYALIRLGIGNSTKIAEILHLSPQTVYNCRMKIRSKAIPSGQKLSEKVKNLGSLKAMDSTSFCAGD